MSVDLFIEVDTGEVFGILLPNGTFAGKAIYSFETIFLNYEHYDHNSSEYKWFNKFKKLVRTDLSLVGKILYSGNWDYDENEYDRFVACEQYHSDMSKEEFIRTINAVDKMWTNIDDVVSVIRELIRILPKTERNVDWFSLDDTILEYKALLDTLLLVKTRRGEEVRFIGE